MAKCANDILADRDLALSVQVLKESCIQAIRASRSGRHYASVRVTNLFR